MKARSAAAILLLTTVVLASSSSIVSAGQPRTHDGFFLRMCVGGGWANTKIEDPAQNVDLEGSTFDLEIAIGGMVAPNLALHGTFWGPMLTDPDATIDGITGTLEGDVDFVAIGGGMTYYFMPVNLYVSGSMGFGSITFDTRLSDYETKDGVMFDATVGKEWWVGNSWGLGLNGGFSYHSIPDGGVSGDWTGTSYSVRFSATLN